MIAANMFFNPSNLVRGMIYSFEAKSYCEGRELGKQILDRASENGSLMNGMLKSNTFDEESFMRLMYADAISSITKSDTLGDVLLIPRNYLEHSLDDNLKRYADISRGVLDEIVCSLKDDRIIKK